MADRSYTIGQAAKLTGLSVRRLRFYADEGLLPAERTGSGYRLFNDADLVRIDLITHLRKADISLNEIRQVLTRQTSIRDVLMLRLQDVETLIASQRRVASVLRAALRSAEPTNEDLRRTWIMLTLSQAERRDVIAQFFDKVSEDNSVDRDWKAWMVEMSTPALPEEPNPEQIDAWIELQGMLNDPAFLALMRENAKGSHNPAMNHTIFAETQAGLLQRATDAMEQGLEPTSEVGLAIGDDFIKGWARAHGVEAGPHYYARMKRHFDQYKPASDRYWSLVRVLGGMRGKAAQTGKRQMEPEKLEALNKGWVWVDKAMKHRLSQVS